MLFVLALAAVISAGLVGAVCGWALVRAAALADQLVQQHTSRRRHTGPSGRPTSAHS